jgi:RNA polymerase sporulation-specific sigma factor
MHFSNIEIAHTRSNSAESKVIACAKRGNEVALNELFVQYAPLVRHFSRIYYLVGADREDVIQEGMIGLFKSIRDFDETKNVPFRSFASMCINRQILTAVHSALRQKHMPLNGYVSLEELGEDFLPDNISYLPSKNEFANPEDLYIHAEQLNAVKSLLSAFETEILELYLAGYSYQQIADQVRKPVKSVDNAVQRIKRKVVT